MNTFNMPVYRVGSLAVYKGVNYNIERVVISGYNIYLTLNDMSINSRDVYVPPTTFVLERVIP